MLVRHLLGWEGDTGGAAGRVHRLPAAPRGRAPRVPLAAGLERVPERARATCSTSGSRRPARRRGWTSSRRPRSTRRCTGWRARRPSRRPRATCCTSPRRAGRRFRRVVHKALHGTPIVLTEHGVYLRESYLAAVRGGDTPGTRFANTRLARGLTRSAYAGADVICPVTDANAYWEMGLGIDPDEDPRALQRPRPAGRADRAARHADGRVGRADRPAQGHPHAAAGRGRHARADPGRAVPALRAT